LVAAKIIPWGISEMYCAGLPDRTIHHSKGGKTRSRKIFTRFWGQIFTHEAMSIFKSLN